MTARGDTPTIVAGFIPLVDCAAGGGQREGLRRDAGDRTEADPRIIVANIRDRVCLGQFDVAHMLAGMPIATTAVSARSPRRCWRRSRSD